MSEVRIVTTSRVVNEMLDGWRRMDLDGIMVCFADNARYENIPTTPIVGKSALRDHIQTFLSRVQEVDIIVRNQVETDSHVFNERLDRFRLTDRWLEVPVAGLFEVHDGHIELWRDYFDLDNYRKQLQ